jgi:hypothetical protein
MRGSRRAVIAMVWLLGTGAATAITIEGVRVVGSNVINGESEISPRQANAALSGRTTTTTTTAAAPTTVAATTTTVTTESPTTTVITEAPTTIAETVPATTRTTARANQTTTTRKKAVATTAKATSTTAKGTPPTPAPTSPVTPTPTVTTIVTPPKSTTIPTPPTSPAPTTTLPSQCIQQTRQVDPAGYVTACFTAKKVSVLGYVAFNGWTPQQTSSGASATVKFTKGARVISVTAFWSGGPQWHVTDTG